MLFLVGGFAILCGLLLLGYLFINADPARLARFLKWLGIGLAVLALLALVVSGRLAMLIVPFAMLMPILRRLRWIAGAFRGPSTGQDTTVETPFIRASLDHDTGAMHGTVLQGSFAGMRIEELDRADLVALLRECRTADEEGARLVEAYLDRSDPDWRDAWRGEPGAEVPPRTASSDVSVDEAYAILGLEPGADAEAIKAAHHRLMKQLHPDHGGTDYFAAKLNRARDVLLHR
ncbi:MAG TPA: DnaJ domain-containing protein [Stellaceae bacterium]|jgi:hypothetical protein|nr:DnaJ domain-containing protein [Stellaceae bacterium]